MGLILLPGISGFPDWLPASLRIMAVLGGIGLLLIIALPYIEGWLRKLLLRLPLRERWKANLGALLGRFVLGTKAFINPIRAASFLALTPVIWLLDGFIMVELAKAMTLTLTLPQTLLLIVALGLASALPSLPVMSASTSSFPRRYCRFLVSQKAGVNLHTGVSGTGCHDLPVLGADQPAGIEHQACHFTQLNAKCLCRSS